jgi:uncharacterized lipoprotein YbaY/uncharacterized lipoprotein NlpE involved in copper resistance/heat shock protein HslJ
MLTRSVCLLLAMLLPIPAMAQRVTGTATKRDRMALPPSAVFEARVEDVSRADAPATVIGSVRIEGPGQVPISFAIDVDPARVEAANSYVVRATITIDGRLRYTTDTRHPVLTRGAGTHVDVVMQPVPSGQGSTSAAKGTGAPGATLGPLPATFGGDLPCADCEGLQYRLALFPDGSYFLGIAYLGKGDRAKAYDIGRWVLSSDGAVLVLKGGREAPEMFRIGDANTLRKLDLEGRDIPSALNYTLARTATGETIEPALQMRGLYRYMADAGLFTECLTGQRWPVAQEAGNADLERKYSEARPAAGAEVLVSVEGIVAMRPRMEGSGTQPTLVVTRVIGVWPGQSCGPAFSAAPLEDTHWKLTQLAGTAVAAAAAKPIREPGITLRSADRRASFSGGCNQMVAGYQLDGPRITFGKAAGTLMACPPGLDRDREFGEALTKAASWRVLGRILELFDADGRLLARFEASEPAR